jgi:hypothetical protein
MDQGLVSQGFGLLQLEVLNSFPRHILRAELAPGLWEPGAWLSQFIMEMSLCNDRVIDL